MATQKIFLRSQFNYDTDQASTDSGLTCKDESLAQQHQKDEADINTIIKRFGISGQLPENLRVPQYGDFTGVTDYHTAQNLVIAADEAFMRMPADIRARFNNNAGAFVAFVSDENNLEEMEKLGIVTKKTVEPAPVPKAAEPPKTAPTA